MLYFYCIVFSIKCRNDINSEKIRVPDGSRVVDSHHIWNSDFPELMSFLHLTFLIILTLEDSIFYLNEVFTYLLFSLLSLLRRVFASNQQAL